MAVRGPYLHVPSGQVVKTQHDAGIAFYGHECDGEAGYKYKSWACSGDNNWWTAVKEALSKGELKLYLTPN
jgi:hypothetical protein